MISKKIQKTDKNQSLRSYVYSVINYVTNPDTTPDPETGIVNKGEKCVAVATNCLYDSDVKSMVNEMVDSIKSIDADSGSQPIVHRIISFKKDERLTEKSLIDIAHKFMKDLGYTEAHQYIISIHNDTDNLHMHIVSNRYNTLDNTLLEEGNGWDELESRRACVRLEKEYGLSVEPGSRFIATEQTEKVSHVNPFTGEVVERERACVEQVRKEKPGPDIRDRARWGEMKTGLKSKQRVLQEIFTELRPTLTDKMNFGLLYRALAEKGVQCEVVKHGKNSYLTYSIDGNSWEKPSDIHPDFSVKSLEIILKSTVRKPKDELTTIAIDVRKSLEVNMTDETTRRMTYSKEQIAALRTIPITEVQKAFDLQESDSKKIRNGVDVLVYQKNMQYADAVDTLAKKFTTVISGEALVNSIDMDTLKKRLELAGVPDSLQRTGTDVLKQLDAFGADKYYIYGSAPDRNFSSAQQKIDGWTKEEVLENLGFLAKMNMNGGHIYIDPKYDDTKIKIPVDDVQQSFITKYRPSMTLQTSREKQQAHYVIDRKYEKEFYNILTENINYRFGDPKIKTADHDSRLAGFTNRKEHYIDDKGNFPFVKVVQSTPVRCQDFEQYVDEQYILYKQNKLKPLNPEKKLDRFSTQQDRDNDMKALQERTMPPILTNKAFAYQEKLRQQYQQMLDRSRADAMTAEMLYKLNATPDQVYTFLRKNALQDNELVTRYHSDGKQYKVKKNVTDEAKERYARRTAINIFYDKKHTVVNLPTANIPAPETNINRWKQEQTVMPTPAEPTLYSQNDRTLAIEVIAQERAVIEAEKALVAAAEAKQAEEARAAEERQKALAAEQLERRKTLRERYDQIPKYDHTPIQTTFNNNVNNNVNNDMHNGLKHK